eukprot:3941921-Rhodomonas_salina.6
MQRYYCMSGTDVGYDPTGGPRTEQLLRRYHLCPYDLCPYASAPYAPTTLCPYPYHLCYAPTTYAMPLPPMLCLRGRAETVLSYAPTTDAPLWAYDPMDPTTLCPTYMVLRTAYAVSGTEVVYGVPGGACGQETRSVPLFMAAVLLFMSEVLLFMTAVCFSLWMQCFCLWLHSASVYGCSAAVDGCDAFTACMIRDAANGCDAAVYGCSEAVNKADT